MYRRSGLLKGGASRFIITLRLTFTGTSSQIAWGDWFRHPQRSLKATVRSTPAGLPGDRV
jgi:hypothetical protein